MKRIGATEARTHLPRLLDRVARSERLLLADLSAMIHEGHPQ
jgi:antitoxin (DNA-binding transcriptional repressor) of toxin-antitoxin stability system